MPGASAFSQAEGWAKFTQVTQMQMTIKDAKPNEYANAALVEF